MANYLLVNGEVVLNEGSRICDVLVRDGVIAELGVNLSSPSAQTIDLRGGILMPGIVDAHVHFNEPGRTDWEGFTSGSAALALGGGTCFFDMPLNSDPPLLDTAAFQQKEAAGLANSLVDFGLWGGLTPNNLDQLERLADAGVIGFKAFMSNSGIPEFPRADHATLRRGMEVAARYGLPVGVHAEDENLVARLTADRRRLDQPTWDDYLSSRPVEAELLAIRELIDLTGETGCKLHVVHVSNGEGVRLLAAARETGLDISIETCPHYLLLDASALAAIGAPAKCAPPLRVRNVREDLWQELRPGRIDTLGSDHSPAPPELKSSSDPFAIWGGIAGCQHGFVLALDEWQSRGRPWHEFARFTASNVADRFGIARRKGEIAVGRDADLVVWRPAPGSLVVPDELVYRHRITPYGGRAFGWKVQEVWVRGRLIVQDGKVVTQPGHACRLSPA